MLTRRALLGTVAAGASAGKAYAAAELASLSDAAARAGLRFGSDSDELFSRAPPEYGVLFRSQCRLYAPLFAWTLSQSGPDQPDLSWTDPNLVFAGEAGMMLTGGHLLWHLAFPKWVGDLPSRDATEQAILNHVDKTVRAYRGGVWSWNVVNEAIDTRSGDRDGMRNWRLRDLFGESYFDIAFHAAHAADPSALLTYNDGLLEMAGPAFKSRRKALLALLDRLIARKVPIQAVGLQSHIRLDTGKFEPDVFEAFLQQIADRGLKILITELDVLDDGTGPGIAERDAAVASMYSHLLEVALQQRAVVSVVTWGLSDRYTWLSPTVSPDLGLRPGPPRRPLPFDADFRPKPAYEAILAAFRAAPPR